MNLEAAATFAEQGTRTRHQPSVRTVKRLLRTVEEDQRPTVRVAVLVVEAGTVLEIPNRKTSVWAAVDPS
jgi:hypothetical protein